MMDRADISVMIVDDEYPVREKFTKQIPWAQHGFGLIGAAANGYEALAMMENHPAHLLLLDITMPVMDGLELAEIVKTRWPKTRILFLTAHDEFAFVHRALQLRADDYLLKAELSTEQVLATCTALAETIREDRNRESRLNKDRQERIRYEWANKRTWLMELLKRPTSERLAESWEVWKDLDHETNASALQGCSQTQFCSVFWIGWEVYSYVIERKFSEEKLQQLQYRMAEAVKDMHQADCQLYVYPYKLNKLAVIVLGGGNVSLSTSIAACVPALLDRLELLSGSSCFASVQEPVNVDNITCASFQEGLTSLTSYFYSGRRIVIGAQRPVMKSMDQAARLELVLLAKKTFYGHGFSYLENVAATLTASREQPLDPDCLLRESELILEGETSGDLSELRHALHAVDTREQFTDWWQRVLRTVWEFAIPPIHKISRIEIQDACKYIAEHYREDLSLAQLADQIGLNANYLGQLFKTETGEYFSDYVNLIRMTKAKDLLARSSMMIYEVAHEVGISDYRYFCKLFKKMIGVTPSQYRLGR